ncbi:hypothetical protein DXG03_002535 [Asterophora parasitica]|uniref:Endonuclease/exonuclease/phosphatase domain-containing protein n=1 Tax=Asterophora parasitica TaxID=117018 RepID=A0A9P7KAZ2_9AGAR|nr:hypothetical protein DXG03_002535 [Asterophora parasitica]
MNVAFFDECENKLVSTKVYRFRPEKGRWRHVSAQQVAEQSGYPQPSSIILVTWNIDFQSGYVKERTNVVVRHLETYVFKCDVGQEPNPCCIMLQEVNPEALTVILENAWIRQHFQVTPISPDKLSSGVYGNVTLVTRSIVVLRASIVTFGCSSQGRGAVVADVKVSSPKAHNPRDSTLRLINTHLESLDIGIPIRGPQLNVLAALLRRKEVKGGVIAGDLNAFDRLDEHHAERLGLEDAWTTKSPSNYVNGHTWGYQDTCEFPPNRLDRIYYVEGKAYELECPKRIGVGLRAPDENGVLVAWASDHYGLSTPLRVARYINDGNRFRPQPSPPPVELPLAMKSVFATLAVIGLAASSAFAQGQLTINTPILPGNQPGAPALQSFGQVEGTSLTWTVNIAAGTSIGLTLRDSTGNTAQSAPFTVNAGGDTSCVGKDPTSSGPAPTGVPSSSAGETSATPAPSSSATPTTAAPPTTPTAPTAPATTAPATTASTSRASQPASSTSGGASGSPSPSATNSAPAKAANFGAAAIVGAVAIALLA